MLALPQETRWPWFKDGDYMYCVLLPFILLYWAAISILFLLRPLPSASVNFTTSIIQQTIWCYNLLSIFSRQQDLVELFGLLSWWSYALYAQFLLSSIPFTRVFTILVPSIANNHLWIYFLVRSLELNSKDKLENQVTMTLLSVADLTTILLVPEFDATNSFHWKLLHKVSHQLYMTVHWHIFPRQIQGFMGIRCILLPMT